METEEKSIKSLVVKLAPVLFVLLWSTGFVGAKWGLPYAPPFSFLTIRYVLVIALMVLLALASRISFPRDPRQWMHLGIAGLLIHGVYLGGVFSAIYAGLPAGTAAVIVGLQPIFTALGAGIFLQERVTKTQWLGLVIGIIGVAFVVLGKWGLEFRFIASIFAVVALIGMTVGVLYQKKFCTHFDWRTGAVLQFLPSTVITAALAFLLEDFRIEWKTEFIYALAWLVLVLSVGAVGLLNILIRSGSSIDVARLFYLTPIFAALQAWLFFDETMTQWMILGMFIAVTGVLLSRGNTKNN